MTRVTVRFSHAQAGHPARQRLLIRCTGAVPRLHCGMRLFAVLIEFEAGYGAGWNDLPADISQAVLMLAAHYYEYLNDIGLAEGCMPFGVSCLIERFKTMRIGMGAGR